MNNTTLTLTPVSNVDFEALKVKDDGKITQRDLHSDSLVTIFDTKEEDGDKEKNIKLIDISIFDHYLVMGGNYYKILHAMWK